MVQSGGNAPQITLKPGFHLVLIDTVHTGLRVTVENDEGVPLEYPCSVDKDKTVGIIMCGLFTLRTILQSFFSLALIQVPSLETDPDRSERYMVTKVLTPKPVPSDPVGEGGRKRKRHTKKKVNA